MPGTTDSTKPPRAERLEARISKEQKRLFMRAAALEGRSLTDFVVSSAQEAAKKTVREHTMLSLGAQDQEVFVAALLGSTPPGEELRAAAQRYRDRRGG